MSSTIAEPNKTKVLLDLKPAFDGYAGIPQETRLLFRGLLALPNYTVEGLIQHGGRRLKSGIADNHKALSSAKQINRLSRVIVSLHADTRRRGFFSVVDEITNYLTLVLLRSKALTGVSLTSSSFKSDLFEDFIWRTLFSKTLKSEDMHAITSAYYRILQPSKKLLHQVSLASPNLAMGRNVILNTNGFDFFLAQTPFPGRVSKNTRMVVRYHDAIPILMPHTIKDPAFHQASHFYTLQANVRAGAWFSCVSESTRDDLLKLFPQVEANTTVIHNIVSDEYFEEHLPKTSVLQIIRTRLANVEGLKTNLAAVDGYQENGLGDGGIYQFGKADTFDYILMVSTLEPRKNHLLLLEAWERLKYTNIPDLKLVVVGSLGWGYQPIINAFKPWAERGELFYLNNVSSAELRLLYKHASVTVCPSFAEGFGYSGVEAMRCGGIVASSDIPVHREIYGNGSAYFNPYSTEEAATVIGRLVLRETENTHAKLRAEGRIVSERYTKAALLPKWDEFFQGLKRRI